MQLGHQLAAATCIWRNSRSVEIRTPDPFGFNRPSDRPVIVTDRALMRLASMAAEAGALRAASVEFSSPVAFLLSPLNLLGGLAPIDTFGDREAFLAVMTMLRLELPLACSAYDLNQVFKHRPSKRHQVSRPACTELASSSSGEVDRHLFTCSVSAEKEGTWCHAFAAIVARDERQFVSLLARRWGSGFADQAMVVRGFDWSEPIANALVSEAVADMLKLVGAAPNSSFAADVQLFIEQSFRA